MKKSVYWLCLVAMSLVFVGCDKDKGGNNDGRVYAYAPDQCFNGVGFNQGFNNFNQFNQFGNFNYGQRYQWRNSQCVDTQDGSAVPQNLCQNINFSNNPNCTYYGQGNFIYNGGIGGAYNACSIYNTPFEQFYPVYYAHLGTTVCAGYSAYNTFYQYGSPIYYPGYNNVFHGCTPGFYTPNCNCKTFGGTLGWFHAGATLGVCY